MPLQIYLFFPFWPSAGRRCCTRPLCHLISQYLYYVLIRSFMPSTTVSCAVSAVSGVLEYKSHCIAYFPVDGKQDSQRVMRKTCFRMLTSLPLLTFSQSIYRTFTLKNGSWFGGFSWRVPCASHSLKWVYWIHLPIPDKDNPSTRQPAKSCHLYLQYQ